MTKQKRNERIKQYRERGLKLREIAWETGLSVGRVSRILKPNNTSAAPKPPEVMSE